VNLALQLTLTCSVCEQNLDSEKRRATLITANLFGAGLFAVCPCCGQRPANDTWAYRRRAREHMAGERPGERPGLKLYARRAGSTFQWVYREARREGAR
jgi:hypothetical protein